MTESEHQQFLQSIKDKKKCRITFYSDKDGGFVVRKTAPIDYGIPRTVTDDTNRYHFWDYESDTKPHPLMLTSDKIQRIEFLEENFDPAGFVKPSWKLSKEELWHYPRDWGEYS